MGSQIQLRHELVTALMRTYAVKDTETVEHIERVGEYAGRVAQSLGLDNAEAALVAEAARLCDLGKIAISDLILAKPGALDSEEWEQVRQHPIVGAKMVEDIQPLRPLAQAIRHHHEHYDGRGYPDGLAGEDIPLHARIIGVCDAYDAMLSDRPYRPALSPSQAEQELCQMAGFQFDPEVVQALLEVVETRASR